MFGLSGKCLILSRTLDKCTELAFVVTKAIFYHHYRKILVKEPFWGVLQSIALLDEESTTVFLGFFAWDIYDQNSYFKAVSAKLKNSGKFEMTFWKYHVKLLGKNPWKNPFCKSYMYSEKDSTTTFLLGE